jgi:hypothetical protein
MPDSDLTIQDMIRAYRNAKVDCFYEKGQLNALKFAEYERHLIANLEQLRLNILSGTKDWIDPEFLGTYTLQLKKITPTEDGTGDVSKKRDDSVFYSSKEREWKAPGKEKMDVEYRLAGSHSVNFHILSSLWIENVGTILERKIGTYSYGSRLKHHNEDLDSENTIEEKYSAGHFRPYYKDYKGWQRDGVSAIEAGLKKGKSLIAITTDVTSFYHRICPEFLEHSDFLELMETQLDTLLKKRLTNLLVTAIKKWSSEPLSWFIATYKNEERDHCGIPITLSASKVIANLLLASFDNDILNELTPVYYGRYVDDIFLVIEDRGKINTREELWNHLIKRIDRLRVDKESNSGPTYTIPFAKHSQIEFGKDKEKLFFLEGSSGKAFIEALTDSLNEMSSEWRMLPDCEEDLENLSREIAKTASNNSDEVTGLRKADKISIQRLKFALHLRNFEIIVRLLPKELWIKGVNKFFKLTTDFVVTPERLPTYSPYYARLLSLAVAANEPGIAFKLWEEIDNAWDKLRKRSKDPGQCDKARTQSFLLRVEAIYTSLNPFTIIDDDGEWTKLIALAKTDIGSLRENSKDLFFADLHAIPFKQLFLQPEKFPKGDELKELAGQYRFTGQEIYTACKECAAILAFLEEIDRVDFDGEVPNALLFYTRRFSVLEITELVSDWASQTSIQPLNDYLKAFNRRALHVGLCENKNTPLLKRVTIPPKRLATGRNPVLALTSFQTADESWIAHVREDKWEPDVTRYLRLFKLTNSILSCKAKRIDYAVFPELSLPRSILNFVAMKLGRAGISTIAGVEYEIRPSGTGESPTITGLVSNQLVYVLDLPNHGFHQQVMIVQEKTIPAVHEEHDLFQRAGKRLMAKSAAKYIISHREFTFTGLICNDLLNIDHRQSIRGEVDALIVVEWNKDVDMYDSIVQSTAGDLHTFVVQVNNRLYGDTRLRGPYKESYKRDMVRVRGGELDYFVVSTIDIVALREFQRNYRSPDGTFKPVPTGFSMSDKRRQGLVGSRSTEE